MKTSLPNSAGIQKSEKHASYHARRLAAFQIERVADEIRQRLPHGGKAVFNLTVAQMVKQILTPSATGKARCTFDRKNRVNPLDELPVDTVRLLSVHDFISVAVAAGKHEAAFEVVELAQKAPENFPFAFSKLDAWRMVVDFMIGDEVYRRGFHVISRKEAREQNLPTFFTNDICDNGKFERRRTSDGACLCADCLNHRAALERLRRARNPGQNRLTCKSYRVRKVIREMNGGAA